MVGIILLKNTENGSYRYFRITVCEGEHYSDISTDNPFITYEFDFLKRCINSVFRSENSENLYFPLADLYRIYDGAVTYLFNHTEAVQLLFKYREGHADFKINSTSEGVFQVPDYSNLFRKQGLYLLCGGIDERISPFEGSVLCGICNCAVESVFNGANRIFYYCCGDMYADVSLFLRRRLSKRLLRLAMTNEKGLYKSVCEIYKKSGCIKARREIPHTLRMKEIKNFDFADAGDTPSHLIEVYRYAKFSAQKYLQSSFENGFLNSKYVRKLFELPHDSRITELARKCCDEFVSCSEKLSLYGYFENPELIKYTDVNLLLTSFADANARSRLNFTATCSKKNYRLISAVPPPEIVDCFGRGYHL